MREPGKIHSRSEVDQSELVQSNTEAESFFLESSFEHSLGLHRFFFEQRVLELFLSSPEHSRMLSSCLGCSQFLEFPGASTPMRAPKWFWRRPAQ